MNIAPVSTDDLSSGCDDMPKKMPGFVYRHFLHQASTSYVATVKGLHTKPALFFQYKDAKVSKLMTKEDNYHIHKTLGILCLLSFFYRYGYVYNIQGNLGFEGSGSKWVLHHTLAAHA